MKTLMFLLIVGMLLSGCTLEESTDEKQAFLSDEPRYISQESLPDTYENPQPLAAHEQELIFSDEEGFMFLESTEGGIQVNPVIERWEEEGYPTDELTGVHIKAPKGEILDMMAIKNPYPEDLEFLIFVLTDQEMVKWTSVEMDASESLELEQLPIYGIRHLSREYVTEKFTDIVYGIDSTGRKTDLVTLSDLKDLYANSWILETDERSIHLAITPFNEFFLVDRRQEDYDVHQGVYHFGYDDHNYREEPEHLELAIQEDGVRISGLYHVELDEGELTLVHEEGYPILAPGEVMKEEIVFRPAYDRQVNLAEIMLYDYKDLREELLGSYRALMTEKKFLEGDFYYEMRYAETHSQDVRMLRMNHEGELFRQEGDSWIKLHRGQ